MSDRERSTPRRDPEPGSNTEKPVEDWTTGDEPDDRGAGFLPQDAVGRGAARRSTPSLTKAEASRRIDELQEKTGRGRSR